MINKIKKFTNSGNVNFLKLFFFLKYIVIIFLFFTSLFLIIPKFIDYEKQANYIKIFLSKNYNFKLNNFSKIEYEILPIPKLVLKNTTLENNDSFETFRAKKIDIILNLKDIYNLKNLKSEKIIILESKIVADIDRTKKLFLFLSTIKKSIKFENLDIILSKENNRLVTLDDLNFTNYGFKRNKIHGLFFGKKFKAQFDEKNKQLIVKILNTGLEAKVKFYDKNLPNTLTGLSEVNILKSIAKFNFYLTDKLIKLENLSFKNKKIFFLLDSLINYKPYFEINSNIHIKKINNDLFKNFTLDKVIQNKDLFGKINGNNKIKYSSNGKELILNQLLDLELAYGRINFLSKTIFSGGSMICEGYTNIIEDYPRLNFNCRFNIDNLKKLFRKISLSKKIEKNSINFNIQGSLNLLSKRANFEKIGNNKNYLANKNDLKRFEEKFENILYDEQIFSLLKVEKIKKFILESF